MPDDFTRLLIARGNDALLEARQRQAQRRRVLTMTPGCHSCRLRRTCGLRASMTQFPPGIIPPAPCLLNDYEPDPRLVPKKVEPDLFFGDDKLDTL